MGNKKRSKPDAARSTARSSTVQVTTSPTTVPTSLADLAPEIILHNILPLLSLADLASVASTCRDYRALGASEWTLRTKGEMGNLSINQGAALLRRLEDAFDELDTDGLRAALLQAHGEAGAEWGALGDLASLALRERLKEPFPDVLDETWESDLMQIILQVSAGLGFPRDRPYTKDDLKSALFLRHAFGSYRSWKDGTASGDCRGLWIKSVYHSYTGEGRPDEQTVDNDVRRFSYATGFGQDPNPSQDYRKLIRRMPADGLWGTCARLWEEQHGRSFPLPDSTQQGT